MKYLNYAIVMGANEELQRHDMSAYTVRSCGYCGNKFPLTSKNKLFCCDNHRIYAHNLQKRIEKELHRLESEYDCIPEFFEINIENIKIKCNGWDDKLFYFEIALDDDNFVHCFSQDDGISGLEMYNKLEFSDRGEKLQFFAPATNEIPIWRYLQVYIMLLEFIKNS